MIHSTNSTPAPHSPTGASHDETLGPSTVETPKEMQKIEQLNLLRNKTLFDFSLETALQIKDDSFKSKALKDIAKEQTKNGNIVGAKETILLIEDFSFKSKALKNMVHPDKRDFCAWRCNSRS